MKLSWIKVFGGLILVGVYGFIFWFIPYVLYLLGIAIVWIPLVLRFHFILLVCLVVSGVFALVMYLISLGLELISR